MPAKEKTHVLRGDLFFFVLLQRVFYLGVGGLLIKGSVDSFAAAHGKDGALN